MSSGPDNSPAKSRPGKTLAKNTKNTSCFLPLANNNNNAK